MNVSTFLAADSKNLNFWQKKYCQKKQRTAHPASGQNGRFATEQNGTACAKEAEITLLQNDADEARTAFVDDPLQGFLQFAPCLLGHMQKFRLKALVYQLVETFAKNVGLPDADGILLKLLKQTHD